MSYAEREGHVALLALDWNKAFDSINVDALMEALEKFGVPRNALSMIREIYRDRDFSVADGPRRSRKRNQLSGIS